MVVRRGGRPACRRSKADDKQRVSKADDKHRAHGLAAAGAFRARRVQTVVRRGGRPACGRSKTSARGSPPPERFTRGGCRATEVSEQRAADRRLTTSTEYRRLTTSTERTGRDVAGAVARGGCRATRCRAARGRSGANDKPRTRRLKRRTSRRTGRRTRRMSLRTRRLDRRIRRRPGGRASWISCDELPSHGRY
jgi:hypothetical protein